MSNVHYLNSRPVTFRHASHHASVDAVMADAALSSDEKRAILSSWASDMYAVEGKPALRHIPGQARPLALSDILRALRRLDDPEPPHGGGIAAPPPMPPVQIDAHASPPGDHGWRKAAQRAHLSNIRRYERLLRTHLTDLERDFIRRRMAEEYAALDALAARRAPALAAAGGQ